jgi:hypothetical protein
MIFRIEFQWKLEQLAHRDSQVSIDMDNNLIQRKKCLTLEDGLINVHLIAGGLAGIVGLLAFLVIHHYWITPIWFILPIGLFIAALEGLAVGWAFHKLSPNLPAHPWNVLAFMALIGIILAPAIILAEIRQPLFSNAEGGRI